MPEKESCGQHMLHYLPWGHLKKLISKFKIDIVISQVHLQCMLHPKQGSPLLAYSLASLSFPGCVTRNCEFVWHWYAS